MLPYLHGYLLTYIRDVAISMRIFTDIHTWCCHIYTDIYWHTYVMLLYLHGYLLTYMYVMLPYLHWYLLTYIRDVAISTLLFTGIHTWCCHIYTDIYWHTYVMLPYLHWYLLTYIRDVAISTRTFTAIHTRCCHINTDIYWHKCTWCCHIYSDIYWHTCVMLAYLPGYLMTYIRDVAISPRIFTFNTPGHTELSKVGIYFVIPLLSSCILYRVLLIMHIWTLLSSGAKFCCYIE